MKGKNNEDRFGVSAFRIQAQPATPVVLAILSDGIGGHRAGEVASELAVNLISQVVADSDGRDPLLILEEAIHQASAAIHQQAQENLEQAGMGATCACAWIVGDRLHIATVGDSRIYLMRGETIHQLSTDHTWIQEALERGLIEPEQVEGHPNAHVIRRYLGSPVLPEVDFRIRISGDPSNGGQEAAGEGLRLAAGDRILLCSDGLTDLVDDAEILTAFENDSLEEAGQKLVDLANQRGGHDNITLVAIQVPDTRGKAVPAPPAVLPAGASRSFATGCLGVIFFAILAGALAGGWLLFNERVQPTATLDPALLATLTASPTPSATPTMTVTRTRPPTATPVAPQPTATRTATRPAPGLSPSLTPIRLNTPTSPLPVVTTTPQP
jgi:protein phosphatase